MKLVLADIYRWKTQLEDEMVKIDENIKHLQVSRKAAKQKIKEAGNLLAAHDFALEEPEEVEEEAADEAVAVNE